MFKKSMVVLISLIFTIVSFSVVFSSEGPAGNDRKGKYTYRKVYKACAETGEIESATPKLSPADKTMEQWKTIFEAKTFEEFGCKDNWAAISDSDILDIYSYFYHHASDSPTPATCK
ncbi:MAG: cytochrome c family protein [Proteobacteria bacterium]|nr:cytochrome c family protein [Pseudomonadota bacterium]MBU1583674.1 cytochrome c family protein [Pseudomonadota bacterium]MBU2453814.1 cytochrome c family protein [Pseudomonadota bacterium]MBU2630586.1 cytochrome c family protein [Pseudomonadota bacterium]